MNNLKYKHLFEPIIISGTLFKNRIITSSMGYLDVLGNRDSGYTHKSEAAAFYERRAAGGSGMVTVGSCYIDKEFGDFGDRHVFLDDQYSLFSLYDIAQSITRYGAVASAEVIHCGLYSNRKTGEPSYGPVAMEDMGRQVYEMSDSYILAIIEKFADAAVFAKRCGFGMITIHGAHGWLISQFLSPKLNTRNDKWGGAPIENRARLPLEICKAIRQKTGPGFPIEIRISGSECYDGGYGIEEGVALAKQLDGYADLIHVSAGSHEIDDVFTITHPSMFLDEGCNSVFAAEIKKNVSQSKVVTVGAFSDPELMDDIIASGKADFIAMARSLIVDPDLPNKIRAGRESEMIKCMRCLSCFSNVQNNGKFYCALNPKSGKEYSEKFDLPTAQKKKVLIAGGGVGGMQAALSCAERGHEVILYEKESRLGGVLRCEENVPFKRNLSRYLDGQEKAITAHPLITLRLNTELTPETAAQIGADVIIAATGARAAVPPIKGVTAENSAVMPAVYAYMNPEETGSAVILLGGGLVGVELGIYLAQIGRKVTILEMQDKLDDGGNHLHAKGLAVEIKRHGIDIHLGTKALEITENGVLAETKDGKQLFEADTIVFATGQIPLQNEAMGLHAAAPEFYVLGDCVTPSNITNATSSAYEISRTIGRYT